MTTRTGSADAPRAPSPTPLLERERELGTLVAAIDTTHAGAARLVVIEGRAGIGKSRLLEAVRARATERGLRVLSARGSELEREFPFGAVRQLLEPALADPQTSGRWLAGSAAPAADVFGPPRPGAEQQDASFAALHGLYWLTANAATDGPLVLAIDDLHWIDLPSLRFLAYLARRIEGMPVLMAMTLRTGEPGRDPALIGEILQEPGADVLRPAPLSDTATSALVRARLGADPDPSFNSACHDATGGNPLLLGQLLRSLGDDAVRPAAANAGLVREIGPQAVTRTIILRLARLAPDAVPVAQAVAVLGESAEIPAIVGLAEMDERRVAAALADLARAEILRPERPIDYVHPLVRDAVYRDMAVGRREILHRAAARLLSESGASPERIASHLLVLAPRGDPEVVRTLRLAADAAVARGAPEPALALLRRAIAEPPEESEHPRVTLELGLVESNVEARRGTERLREAFETLDDPVLRLRAARTLVWGLIFTGDPTEAAQIAAEAAATAPTDLEDLNLWLRGLELISIHFGARVPDGLARLERERSRPVAGGIGACALAGITSFDWAIRGGGIAECSEMARAALQDGRIFSAPDGYLLAMGPLLVLEMAEAPDADATWDEAFAAAHRNGSRFSISSIQLWRGLSLLRRGDVPGAISSLEAGHDLLQRWGIASESYAIGFLGRAHTAAGDLTGARGILSRARPAYALGDGALVDLESEIGLLLAEGRHAEALEAAEDLERRVALRGMRETVNPAWCPWRSLEARALAGVGRADEALALLELELQAARRWGAPGIVGRTLRILGETESGDAAIARLESAVETLASSTARLEHARALAALGAALRRGRRPTEAREPLRQALALAEACGAEGLVEHTRTELYATGARPRSAALKGPDSLTPSERRVAHMAAEGQTNRDIAQALYVTPKTVELHLSNAYRKLGVRSRRELPAVLAPPPA